MEITKKDEYYHDLRTIKDSFTGRVDAQIANTFIFESAQLVKNAIVLFEKGYFDCSFYSLRQALEVSRTMVYLVELDPKEKENKFKKWKQKSKFPMFSQMILFLNNNENVFSNMLQNMKDYFEKLKSIKEKLNKHVHKQGFNTFYVSKNHPFNMNKDRTEFKEEFKNIQRFVLVLLVF